MGKLRWEGARPDARRDEAKEIAWENCAGMGGTGARPDARRDEAVEIAWGNCAGRERDRMLDGMPTSSPNSIALHSTTLHYTTLHYIASNYITVHYIHTTQLVHTQLTHTYSSTHDLIILNQHQSVTISFLFPAFPLPSLGLSSQCCSRHAGKNGLLCAVLLLGSLAHLVFSRCILILKQWEK